MFSSVLSAGISGIDIIPVRVEADVSQGLPSLIMVGYLSSQVKEAQERVRTALRNCHAALLPRRITINLAPTDIRKSGSGFDLPMAAAILAAQGAYPREAVSGIMIAGELSLSGKVRKIPGVLPMVLMAKETGCHACIIPKENEAEGRMVPDIKIIGISHIEQMLKYFQGQWRPEASSFIPMKEEQIPEGDFCDIQGQKILKRAAEIAACGFHNLWITGPPGSGKSMLAKRIPGILPDMNWEEKMELTRIYSIAGKLSPQAPLIEKRQFRAPHHTITPQALAGGGRIPRPGEITLAHRGVLFLDELPEFSPQSLETLRQPLEEGKIYLSRVMGNYCFPAQFMLVAASNPCPCGYYPEIRCTCTRAKVKEYHSRVSQPLKDRIDICIQASEITYEELMGAERQETSAEIKYRVERTSQIQKQRFQKGGEEILFNSQMSFREIQKYCVMTQQAERMLGQAYKNCGLSARGYHRVLKVARTIADLEQSDEIRPDHIAEAIGYRVLETEI